MRILLVEDNKTIIKALTYNLEQNNYEVVSAESKEETLKILNTDKVDLIILDITLPDGNGFDLYRNFILQKYIPTIFLTARDDENDIVNGLEMGADDYVTKPFSTKELIARINKILMKKTKNTIIKVKNIKFDLDKMVVYRDEQVLELTSLELKILHLLFLNINKVVTRNDIIEKVWEWTGNDINDNTVTVYLKRIRKKVETDIIKTIKGIGYRIDNDEE